MNIRQKIDGGLYAATLATGIDVVVGVTTGASLHHHLGLPPADDFRIIGKLTASYAEGFFFAGSAYYSAAYSTARPIIQGAVERGLRRVQSGYESVKSIIKAYRK